MVDTWGWGGGGGGRDKWVLGLFQGFLLILKYTFIIIQSRILNNSLCGVEHILFLLMWSSSRGTECVSGREWELKKHLK